MNVFGLLDILEQLTEEEIAKNYYIYEIDVFDDCGVPTGEKQKIYIPKDRFGPYPKETCFTVKFANETGIERRSWLLK